MPAVILATECILKPSPRRGRGSLATKLLSLSPLHIAVPAQTAKVQARWVSTKPP